MFFKLDTKATAAGSLFSGGSLAIGVVMNGLLVKGIEPDAVMYIRSVSFFAWGISAGVNILFALIINTISFRKVGKVPLTDISKY